MNPELRQKLQIVLAAAMIISALRVGYIFYERHEEKIAEAKKAVPVALNPDYYVTPKKLYPYDLKSARQLIQQPVWVRQGYRFTYYRYDPKGHTADFSHEAGLLLPVEKLQIKDVTTDVTPGAPNQRQVMAIFEKDKKQFAFPIGVVTGSDYKIYSDDMLFIQNPHDLYKHWPTDVWESIDKHEVKAGMNELQTSFAVGMGIPESSGGSSSQVFNYPNGGKPLRVVYHDGRVAEIGPGPAS
jgi:hypothetical protein